MDIEVDQSGKIENTRTDTVIAFSNDVGGAVLIPAAIKRACIRALRERDWRSQTFVFKIFAAALFVAIQPYIPRIEQIVIDVEYPGRMGDIKSILLTLIQRTRRNFTRQQITFRFVGKHSPAHKKAISVYRGRALPDRVVTAQEILSLLKK